MFIKEETDFLVIVPPMLYNPMLPSGVGYLVNCFKEVKVDVVDLNIFFYSHYRGWGDPWHNTQTSQWMTNSDLVETYLPIYKELAKEIKEKKIPVVGFSISETNRISASLIVKEIREIYPECVILAGGHDCVRPFPGLRIFDCDYMIIGEGELSTPALIRDLLLGYKPTNMPGILSKNDNKNVSFVNGQVVHDLDNLEFPKYRWTDNIHTYELKHHGTLVPIISTRGCRWAKCRFCCERFSYRKRSPENVIDEIGYWARQRIAGFHFNESDFGDKEHIIPISERIIKRGWRLSLCGQLRIDKNHDLEYFKTLKRAGFAALRFGVDAWTEHELEIQRKGYTIQDIIDNVMNCRKVGIHTSTNIVIGCPGETDDDIDKTIKMIIYLKNYINVVESLNILILKPGSEYYEHTEQYGIEFVEGLSFSEIQQMYTDAIPDNMWWSKNPFIDHDIRKMRMINIVRALQTADIEIGGYAKNIINEVTKC